MKETGQVIVCAYKNLPHGFSVDWKKLFEWLCHERWSCEKVFFYTGLEAGNDALINEFDAISKLPCSVVRTKWYQVFKRKDKTVQIKCAKCGEENVKVVDMGYAKKANCDVDLTMDILENATIDPEVEMMIMTGDGDFTPLIRKVSDIAKKIYIVSSQKRFEKARMIKGRFSTKLRDLINEKCDRITFIEINNWKMKIKRDITT